MQAARRIVLRNVLRVDGAIHLLVHLEELMNSIAGEGVVRHCLTGPTMPYDAFTGDTIHQFFQMYQQMDCAIDPEHVSKNNPTGCLHDLQSAVTTTYSTPLTGTPHD